MLATDAYPDDDSDGPRPAPVEDDRRGAAAPDGPPPVDFAPTLPFPDYVFDGEPAPILADTGADRTGLPDHARVLLQRTLARYLAP